MLLISGGRSWWGNSGDGCTVSVVAGTITVWFCGDGYEYRGELSSKPDRWRAAGSPQRGCAAAGLENLMLGRRRPAWMDVVVTRLNQSQRMHNKTVFLEW